MKIMQFVHALVMGGAETLVKEYSMNYPSTEEIVVLCVDRVNTPYEKVLENTGIRVIYASDYYKIHSNKYLVGRVLNYIKKSIVIRKIIRQEKPDVIHAHLELNIFLKYARPIKPVTLIYTVHSELNKHWNNSRGRKRDLKAAKWLVKNYNMRFIALHERMKDEINELFKVNNTIVVGNGVDFSRFKNLISKEKKRKEFGIPTDAVILGHVGRFLPVKNHEFLLRVFQKYQSKHNNSYLVMVGSGKLLEKIKKKSYNMGIFKNTIFLQNRMDVPDIMNMMDYFVFPSVYEGFPVVLIEAQKVGIKCLVSDTITHEVIVSNLVKSCCLKEGPEVWCEKIENFVIDTNHNSKIDEWDISNIIEKLLKIYREEI